MKQDIRRLRIAQDETAAIDVAVDMSLEDIAAGRVYTQEQAKERRAQLANRLSKL